MENIVTVINLWAIHNVVKTVLANHQRRQCHQIEASLCLGVGQPSIRLQDGQGSAFVPVTTRRNVFTLAFEGPAENPPIVPVNGVSEEEDIWKLVLMAQSLLVQLGLIFPAVVNQAEDVREERDGVAVPVEENEVKSNQSDNSEDEETTKLKKRNDELEKIVKMQKDEIDRLKKALEGKQEANGLSAGSLPSRDDSRNQVLGMESEAPENEREGEEERDEMDVEGAKIQRDQSFSSSNQREMEPAAEEENQRLKKAFEEAEDLSAGAEMEMDVDFPQEEEIRKEQEEEDIEGARMERGQSFSSSDRGESSAVASPRASPTPSAPADPSSFGSSSDAPKPPSPSPSQPSSSYAQLQLGPSSSSAPQSSSAPTFPSNLGGMSPAPGASSTTSVPAAPSLPAAPKPPTPLPSSSSAQPPLGASAPQSSSAPTFPPHILEIQRRAATKNGRGRAEEKQKACEAPNPPLVKDSEAYNQRVKEAMEYIKGSKVYNDDHFQGRRNLFIPSHIKEVPRPVCMKAITAKELYAAWFKVNGKEKNCDWNAIKEANGIEYWEWIGREFEIHEEFLRQVKKGFICAEPMRRERKGPQQDEEDKEREGHEDEEEEKDEPGPSPSRPSGGAASLRKRTRGKEIEDRPWSRREELHKKKKRPAGKKLPMRSKLPKKDSEEELEDSDHDMEEDKFQ